MLREASLLLETNVYNFYLNVENYLITNTFLILSEQNAESNSRKSSKSSVTSSSSSESSSPSIVPVEPPAPTPVVEEICHQTKGVFTGALEPIVTPNNDIECSHVEPAALTPRNRSGSCSSSTESADSVEMVPNNTEANVSNVQ